MIAVEPDHQDLLATNTQDDQQPDTSDPVLPSTGQPNELDDGIHLAPDGVSPCEKAGCTLGAAERRSSFVQMEGRDRSRSVGEKQWTRVRAVMAWYTRLRRIKKSVLESLVLLVSIELCIISSPFQT